MQSIRASFEYLAASFPLHVYKQSNLDVTTPAPSKPSLWIHGPGLSGAAQSYDADCLRWQAALSSAGIEHDLVHWSMDDGAVKTRLPCLHLPDGRLLAFDQLEEYVESRAVSRTGEDVELRGKDAAWCSLVQNKLIPAVKATLYIEPVYNQFTVPLYHPSLKSAPALSQLMHSALATSKQRSVLTSVNQTVSKNKGVDSTSSTVDLSDLEAEAKSALKLCEAHLEQSSSEQWFLGSDAPTTIDAILFAQLSIIRMLPNPPKTDAASAPFLQRELKRCKNLSAWVDRIEGQYFARGR